MPAKISMASKQTGIAVVYGCPGTIVVTGTALVLFNESASFESNFKVDEVRDEDNELRTLIHSGEVYDATLMFTPRAASGTNTLANAISSLLPPGKGSIVTLSLMSRGATEGVGTGHPMTTAFIATNDWVYVGGWKIGHKKDGGTTYEFKIKRNPNFNIGAAVT